MSAAKGQALVMDPLRSILADRLTFRPGVTRRELRRVARDPQVKHLQADRPIPDLARAGAWFGSKKRNDRFLELLAEHGKPSWTSPDPFVFT